MSMTRLGGYYSILVHLIAARRDDVDFGGALAPVWSPRYSSRRRAYQKAPEIISGFYAGVRRFSRERAAAPLFETLVLSVKPGGVNVKGLIDARVILAVILIESS